MAYHYNYKSTCGTNGVSSRGRLPSIPSSYSLVLDVEKGELVKSSGKILRKKDISEAKSLAALKKHCEAERRRRERINGYLATLRALVPPTTKTDKATILAEVISQLKELKKNAMEASKGFLIPTDYDEVKVEPYDNKNGDGSISYKASICCDDRPDLLSDLKQTLDTLQLQLVKTELSTLGDRVKNVFVFTCCKEDINIHIETCQLIAISVRQALSSVLNKASTSQDYSLTTSSQPCKKPRLCLLETSSSSCNHEFCSF
ncbi:unnamed protein product [Lupinus luteus]|uniref:BHLH domain-containing protein n=1 Tax=Lupinus luteus TaxID=3873 RepID=A0AAV1VVD6_LUPLU